MEIAWYDCISISSAFMGSDSGHCFVLFKDSVDTADLKAVSETEKHNRNKVFTIGYLCLSS